jgi:hypothetical protein
MISHFNALVLLVAFFFLSVNVMTQTNNYQNTTEPIGCKKPPYENINYTRLYYEVPPYSRVELPSCENGQYNLNLYWFVLEDICRYNRTHNTFFAIVDSSDRNPCSSRTDLSISFDSCNNNYAFTRQSMIINNMTNTTIQEYICFYGVNPIEIELTSAIGYFITISGKFK